MNKKIFLLLSLFALLTSCIPTKDLTYFQNKKSENKEDLTKTQSEIKPYTIQTHDILKISLKAIEPKLVAMFNVSNQENGGATGQTEQSSYFEGYIVDDHGNIRLPLLGEVNVLGFTTEEIRVKIENLLLTDYFNKEANIFVSVKLAGFRYTINGEITNPGSRILYRDKVNVMEAIANSGDILITGDRKNVMIVRQSPQGAQMHVVDLTDAKVIQSPYYFLQPNDYIYIKPLKQKSWGTGTTGFQSLTSAVSVLTLLISTFLIFKNL